MESIQSPRVSGTIHIQKEDQIISESGIITVIPVYFHVFNQTYKFMSLIYKKQSVLYIGKARGIK